MFVVASAGVFSEAKRGSGGTVASHHRFVVIDDVFVGSETMDNAKQI